MRDIVPRCLPCCHRRRYENVDVERARSGNTCADGNYVVSAALGTLGMNPGTPLLTTDLNGFSADCPGRWRVFENSQLREDARRA
jgi:hypothetical protein